MRALLPSAVLAVALTTLVGSLGIDPVATDPTQPYIDTPGWTNLRLDLTGAPDDTLQIPLHVPSPSATTGIGPGSHLLIEMDGGLFGCTAAFIFTSGSTYYLGAAGHCFIPASATATHGPGADYDPADTTVFVCVSGCAFGGETGFILTGTLVELGPVAYARQTGPGGDIGNDFGIVTIPSNRVSLVREAMPVWGGPSGTEAMAIGKIACHYGNGIVFGEVFPTMARAGPGAGQNSIRWLANSAAAPGDSGSAVNACNREGTSGLHGFGAVGVLTHLNVNTGIVAGTNIAQCISMATQASISLTLESA